MCTVWAVSLRHAESGTTAVRPARLIGGRRGSSVDIVVMARGTIRSSSVGRLYVEHPRFRLQHVYRNTSSY